MITVLNRYNCRIVWSTSNRIHHLGKDALYGEGIESMLKRFDIMEFLPLTMEDWHTELPERGKKRGDEVNDWIKRNEFTGKYICIDDNSDFYPYQPLILTGYFTGFSYSDLYYLETILAIMRKNDDRFTDNNEDLHYVVRRFRKNFETISMVYANANNTKNTKF